MDPVYVHEQQCCVPIRGSKAGLGGESKEEDHGGYVGTMLGQENDSLEKI
ncbi:hypothetical protein HPP92_004765 [Vanilla planifolia]|uniref:Uncharacterized protein n=1 Tax=Vanilla planifolia TaxID=51239 RepID=A0A835RSR1_VANPL|nr:hypothetical protein HPP92_004765 [Vanilla planifolia]